MRTASDRSRDPVRVQIVVTGGTRLERTLVATELAGAAESGSPIEDVNGVVDVRAELSDVEDFNDAVADVLNWAQVSVQI